MSKTPFFVIILVVASRQLAANNYLKRQGYGSENLKIEIIRKTDPDNADAVAYGCLIQCDSAFRTTVARKANELGNDAKVFWSMHRKEAKQQALQKLDDWGYRLKPKG